MWASDPSTKSAPDSISVTSFLLRPFSDVFPPSAGDSVSLSELPFLAVVKAFYIDQGLEAVTPILLWS